MNKTLLVALCGLWLLTGCTSEDGKDTPAERAKSPYFDMLGFLGQLEVSGKGRPLHKTTLGDGKIDEGTQFNPEYRKELAIFYSADIRKPALQNAFTIKEANGVTTYLPKTENPELRLLMVKRDAANRVKRVDVTVTQDNYLYSSDASGVLFIKYKGETPMLDSMSVVGMQKIVFGTPFSYVLQAKVL
jgi:hypothetical protein